MANRGRRARALFALTVAMYVATLPIGAVNLSRSPNPAGDFTFTVLFGIGLVVIGVVGTLVAVRRPRHPVGWVLLGGVFVMTLTGLGQEYGTFALFVEPGLPGGAACAWLVQWFFVPALFVMPSLLLLLFPDGRVASPRWRAAVWLTAAGAASYVLGSLVQPARVLDEPFEGVANPLGISALGPVSEVLAGAGLVAMALAVVLSAISMLLRLRRAHGLPRQQLTWLAAAAAFFALCCVTGTSIVVATGNLAGAVFVVLSFPVIPVTAGVAILRHRLYDVDVVIRRTLIYAIVTATLLGTYVLLVLVLGSLLRPLAPDSDLVVAASTLAVAALFGPVRRRVQTVVDRRFFRRRYDAERTLDAFGVRLRTTTDLVAVGDELVDAVEDTVAPAHLTLWLRDR